jgi:hypothetical protein
VTFLAALDILERQPRELLLAASARQLASALGVDIMKWPAVRPDYYRERREVHPTLFSYLEVLGAADAHEELFELAAWPSRLLKREGPPAVTGKLLPPLVIFSGGRCMWLGLARDWTRDQKSFFFHLSALVGACQRLLTRDRPYQACPHVACPVHETALCSTWYEIPEAGNWQRCNFPRWVSVYFGASPTHLNALRNPALEQTALQRFVAWLTDG